jgi:hypothetical protein
MEESKNKPITQNNTIRVETPVVPQVVTPTVPQVVTPVVPTVNPQVLPSALTQKVTPPKSQINTNNNRHRPTEAEINHIWRMKRGRQINSSNVFRGGKKKTRKNKGKTIKTKTSKKNKTRRR